MPSVVLVSAVRTPVGRAPKGALSTTRPDDLAALALKGALDRVSALDKSEIDDVILGCAQPEGEQGWDVARWAILRAGWPVEIPGVTINRLCSSGLEAIAIADQRIRSGASSVMVAGGVETMSLLPFGGLKPSPNPWMAENYPASLLTMGLTAERVARHYKVSREDQDAFALASHCKALAAQAAGRFNGELIPVPVTTSDAGREGGKTGDDGDVVFRRRRAARGYISGGACQAKAGLPCARDGDGWKFIADIGWRRRRGVDGRGTREGAGAEAAGAHGGVCDDGLPA